MTPNQPATAPPSRFWADLGTDDFASLDLGRTIAVLPVAAIEQHGPHLPLSVDADIARGVLQASLPHLPADLPALFLPLQAVGFSPEHRAFAGTLSLSVDTLVRLWTDIAEGVAASGVRKLLIFNTHGGQVGALDLTTLKTFTEAALHARLLALLPASGLAREVDGQWMLQAQTD